MAQIKKFSGGDKFTPVQDPQKSYGKIYKNGTPYDVHEDTLKWLDGLGSIGMEMAKELRDGIDQHIEIGSDGIGVIRNVSSGVNNLNFRQRRRIGRKQGVFGGLFEDPSTKMTRDIIQGIVEQNYTNFKDARPVFTIPEINLNIAASLDANNNPVFTLVDNDINTSKAKDRIAQILEKKQITIPEGYKYENYDELNELNKYISNNIKTIEALSNKLENNTKLDDNDIAVLKALKIIYTKPTTVGNTSIVDIQHNNAINAAKEQVAQILNINPDDKLLDMFTYSMNGDAVDVAISGDAEKLFGKNYVFSEYDDVKYKPLIGFALWDGKLIKASDLLNRSDFDYDAFKVHINNRDYKTAKKIIGFELPGGFNANEKLWKYYDPTTVSIRGINPNTWYYDLGAGKAITVNWKTDSLLPVFKQVTYNNGNITHGNADKILHNDGNPTTQQIPTIPKITIEGVNGVAYKVNYGNLVTTLFYDAKSNKLYTYDGKSLKAVLTVNMSGEEDEKYAKMSNIINNELLPAIKKSPKSSFPRNISFSTSVINIFKTLFQSTKRNGGILNIHKFASGGETPPTNNNDIITITPIESNEDIPFQVSPGNLPLTLGDLGEGMTPHDWAEVAALITDIMSYGMTHGSKKTQIAGTVIGFISDLMYGYSKTRDGKLDVEDWKNIAINVGTTVGAKNASSKAWRIVGALAQMAGVANAVPAVQNVYSVLNDPSKSWKDIPTDDINALVQGFKALATTHRNYKDVKFMNKYTTKSENTSGTNILSRFQTKDHAEIKRLAVENALGNKEIKDLSKQRWYNSKSKKVKDYSLAFDYLTGTGDISDQNLLQIGQNFSRTLGSRVTETASNAGDGLTSIGQTLGGVDPEGIPWRNLSEESIDPGDKNRASRLWGVDVRNTQGQNVPGGTVNGDGSVTIDKVVVTAKPTFRTRLRQLLKILSKEKSVQAETQDIVTGNPLTGSENVVNPKTISIDAGRVTAPKSLETDFLTNISGRKNHVLRNKLGADWRYKTFQGVPRILAYEPGTEKILAIYDAKGQRIVMTENPNKGLNEFDYVPKNQTPAKGLLAQDDTYDLKKDVASKANIVTYKKQGGVLKAWFGTKIEREFDIRKHDSPSMSAKDIYAGILNDDKVRISKRRRALLSNAIDTGMFWDNAGNFDSNVYGAYTEGKKKNLFGVISPWVEYGITSIGNRKVLDKRTAAKRVESIGAMESMPTKKPIVNLNLNPITTEYENQVADAWSKTTNVNQALSDSRQRIANSTNTMSNIMKGGSDLSTKISNAISDKNTQDLKNDWEYSELERKIASHNQKVGTQTAANILSLGADHTEKEYSNATKLLAEFRADQDNYMKAKRSESLYNNIIKLQNKLADEKLSEDERKTIYQQIATYQKLIDSINIYNKFTGKYAVNIKDEK